MTRRRPTRLPPPTRRLDATLKAGPARADAAGEAVRADGPATSLALIQLVLATGRVATLLDPPQRRAIHLLGTATACARQDESGCTE
jgi:hypothetical protein